MNVVAEDNTRRLGTIWTLGPDEAVESMRPAVAATFCRLGPESTHLFAPALGEKTVEEFKRRLKTGRHCYAAWVGDVLAAYGWVSYHEEFIGELGLTLRLQPGEAYIWDCVTLPDYRQKYLYTSLLIHILGELRAESIGRVWIGADLDNAASQRGIDRAGFRRVADLIETHEHSRRFIQAQGYAGVPESLVSEARRVFITD
jgi:hypothetical protein